MLVNVWSSQISSDDPNVVVEESQKLRELVTSHNESLQGAIFRAWYTIKTRAEVPRDFYDKAFYRYIVYRTVNDSTGPPGGGNDLQAAANAFLRRQDNAATLQKARRDKWGICDAEKYCLGYTELFHPLKPRLTDLLIAVIAAQDPRNAATEALNAMEARTGTPSDDLAKSCESLDRDRAQTLPPALLNSHAFAGYRPRCSLRRHREGRPTLSASSAARSRIFSITGKPPSSSPTSSPPTIWTRARRL
jgi:hypothetical protein